METLLALIIGPVFVVIVGTVVYCGAAVAIDAASIPFHTTEEIIKHRRNKTSE